jgi:WD40 repeat protein
LRVYRGHEGIVEVRRRRAAVCMRACFCVACQGSRSLTVAALSSVAARQDVAWHPHHRDLFGSVGDDFKLLMCVVRCCCSCYCHSLTYSLTHSLTLLYLLVQTAPLVCSWDQRDKGEKARCEVRAHTLEVNCLAFNPFQEYLIVTGSSDRTVALWDMRNLQSKLHSFNSHTNEVFQVQWAPFNESVGVSACSLSLSQALYPLPPRRLLPLPLPSRSRLVSLL